MKKIASEPIPRGDDGADAGQKGYPGRCRRRSLPLKSREKDPEKVNTRSCNDEDDGDGEGKGHSAAHEGTTVPEPAPPTEPEPKRLIRKPSDDLAALYARLDESLAEQSDAAAEWAEARRNLEDAKRWMSEAEERLRRCAEDVRAKTEEMREGEMVEPCPWNDMLIKLRDFREKHGHVDPCPPHRRRGRDAKLDGREKKRRKIDDSGKTEGGSDPKEVCGSNGEEQTVVGEENGVIANRERGEKEKQTEGSDNDPDNNPDNGNDPYADLGLWLENQRKEYKNRNLLSRAPHRVRALEDLGVAWDRNEARWASLYNELLEFKNVHGHTDVSQKYSSDMPKLFHWVRRQQGEREKFIRGEKSQMKVERIELLEEIGFKWAEGRTKKWTDHYADLCAFQIEKGHCDVPKNYEPNPKLGNWVFNQKKFYSQQIRGIRGGESLTAERIKMLEDIGFQWRYSRERKAEHFKAAWFENKRKRLAAQG